MGAATYFLSVDLNSDAGIDFCMIVADVEVGRTGLRRIDVKVVVSSGWINVKNLCHRRAWRKAHRINVT
jgi:hypothetical protein